MKRKTVRSRNVCLVLRTTRNVSHFYLALRFQSFLCVYRGGKKRWGNNPLRKTTLACRLRDSLERQKSIDFESNEREGNKEKVIINRVEINRNYRAIKNPLVRLSHVYVLFRVRFPTIKQNSFPISRGERRRRTRWTISKGSVASLSGATQRYLC